MFKKSLTVAFVLVLALVLAVPAGAITGNWVDDDAHLFVGLVVFYDEAGEFVGRCSGSLLNPTKFLTAGHCVTDPLVEVVSARVYFQQDAGAHYDPAKELDPVTGYPEFCAPGTLGTLCATSDELYNFGFPAPIPNTHDVGLVILDQPIYLSEYGELPAPGRLDELATARGQKNTVFTVSGYGLSLRTEEHSVIPNLSFRIRLMAKSTLVNLDSALNDGYNLQTQGNGDSRGGTCSGDSGGPVFLGGPASNLIVGVTSFGLNQLCRGTDFAYRIDRAEVLNWINNPQ